VFVKCRIRNTIFFHSLLKLNSTIFFLFLNSLIIDNYKCFNIEANQIFLLVSYSLNYVKIFAFFPFFYWHKMQGDTVYIFVPIYGHLSSCLFFSRSFSSYARYVRSSRGKNRRLCDLTDDDTRTLFLQDLVARSCRRGWNCEAGSHRARLPGNF